MRPSAFKKKTEVISVVCFLRLKQLPQDVKALEEKIVEVVNQDNWQSDPAQAAELIAAGLAPTNTLEAGIATTLPPGPYTALLAGLNNGTGVGLVEIYDLGSP